MRPLIFAHRGASGDAPENTMSAFRLALEQGADGIELDVQRTADRKLVVIHDETLERTTDGKGLVATKTYKELSRMNAAAHFGNGYGGEPVPLLEEVLAWIASTSLLLNIELKNGILPYEGMEKEVVELVRHYGLSDRVILSSFNHYSLVTLGRIAPEMERAILYVAGLYEPWEYAGRVGATSLHPYFYNAVQEIIQGTKRAGMKIRPWTVDREEDLSRMISLGVDGIITNYPARTKKILMSM